MLRRLLYSALTLLLFAALLEGVLAMADVASPLGRLSLTRGFSPAVHYFASPDSPGSVRTQMFNGESPEITIPPGTTACASCSSARAAPRASAREKLQASLEEGHARHAVSES